MNTDSYLLRLRLAISMVPGMTAEAFRVFACSGLSHEDFFSMDSPALSAALRLQRPFTRDVRDKALLDAAKELDFTLRHGIRILFIDDDGYPERLRQCYDAPVALFVLGSCDLDMEHAISIVGTRRATNYGTAFTREVVEQLSGWFPHELMVVSGLAYGIDAAAHRTALAMNVPTVAVLAHGLDTIYPAQHRTLAKEILAKGGALISEYPSGTKAFRGNFLARNRIVAGLSDATLVAESAVRGGAISTANMAFEYDRELLALPGRANDELSAGCNAMIRRGKAHMVTSPAEVVEAAGWKPFGQEFTLELPGMFPDFDETQRPIYELLRSNSAPMSVDEIHRHTGGAISELMSTLTEMELDGKIVKYPGNKYSV